IFEALSAADPSNMQARQDLATSCRARGDRLAQTRDTAGALAYYRKGLVIFETLRVADPMNMHLQSDMTETLHPLARLLAQTGQPAEARRMALRALSIQKALAEQPEATANDLNSYARALLTAEPSDLRDPAAALPHARRAVEMTKENAPRMLDTMALAYYLVGDHGRAVETEQKAIILLKADSLVRRELETNLAKFQAAAKGKES